MSKNTKKSTTIDELARMMAKGFRETATKDDLRELRDEFKSDTKDMATKLYVSNEILKLREDIDIMLDRHIGTFRKDYDDLARRVKQIEQVVFKNK